MENRKTSFIRFPSGRKKRVIKTQNALVSSFIREKFEVEPFLVSRDKANHIVVIVLDEGGNRLIAFLLGTDGSKKPTLLTAGKLFFKRENEKEIFVPLFKVINDYKGSGIGTLLLRSFENYAAGEGCSQISLCSLLSASKLKSIHKPEDETGNGLKYLTYPSGKLKKKYSNYFDKNLYFYYSNGFEMIDDPTIAGYDRDNIPLAKKPIHEVDLQYGVRGKKYLFRPTDPRFRISTLHIDMDYLTEESVHLEGKAIEKAFVPYKCQDDEKGIAALEEFLRSESSELEKN